LDVRCDIWNVAEPPTAITPTVDPDGGSYLCDFDDVGWDLDWGQMVAVMYSEPDGDRVANVIEWPHITSNIGPNSDGYRHVWGERAEPNGAVAVTVTTGAGAFVAGTVTQADETGFFDIVNDFPEGTLAETNNVWVDFANGLTDSMIVYPMNGEADIDTDVVTVTASAPPSFTVDLEFCVPDQWCDVFFMGEIGTSGIVTTNIGTEAGFDVVPGVELHAHLVVTHGHDLMYSWNLPAAEVGVWKWNTGGHARPGGVYVYGINFNNRGNTPAENVLITDTLPVDTSWAGDTSGVTHDLGSGGTITWDLGAVEPGEYAFMVTIDVPPDSLTGSEVIEENCAYISTTTEGESINGPIRAIRHQGRSLITSSIGAITRGQAPVRLCLPIRSLRTPSYLAGGRKRPISGPR
jgi:uncharacterized repeat protein (TIGR01451 family)